ncbi:MAG TPA: NAD(P)-dependent oxidoreductase [Steroidobacteraceae bacterium]|nr:NAD(P)-dependent oxidoreductase [Steroidobacteraceae bacterium]
MHNVGFIGLGVMGLPMACHLCAAGFPLTAYDIDPRALQRLAHSAAGVEIADSATQVAAASDIVVTMLPHGGEVQSVVFGSRGLAAGFRRGCLLVDTSSSEPWHTKDTAARLKEIGVDMVDAPVSGAEVGAVNAELLFMVGGEDAAVERARPLFDVLGDRVFHLGPIGSGHAMKSINNLITAATFLATAEGLVTGARYGLDPAAMTGVLNASTGMSWVSRTHIVQRILSRRFDDPFKFDLMVKDIDIALQMASELGLEMRLSQANQSIWHESQREIAPGSSVSELVRCLESRARIELNLPGDEA